MFDARFISLLYSFSAIESHDPNTRIYEPSEVACIWKSHFWITATRHGAFEK